LPFAFCLLPFYSGATVRDFHPASPIFRICSMRNPNAFIYQRTFDEKFLDLEYLLKLSVVSEQISTVLKGMSKAGREKTLER
jgi:hypothetical protein